MAPFSNFEITEIVSRVSSAISDSPAVDRGKQFVSDAAYVTKKLLRSTGNAAWITGTTFVILLLPFMIQIERHAQFDNELQGLYGPYGNSPSYTVQ